MSWLKTLVELALSLLVFVGTSGDLTSVSIFDRGNNNKGEDICPNINSIMQEKGNSIQSQTEKG